MQTLDAIDDHGRGLRVVFQWQGDRFAHWVHTIDPDRDVPLLATCEGDDQQTWPPSPPLQDLSVQHLAEDRQVAFLVGMAGSSHWSLSVEPHPERKQLIFDVACRVLGAAAQLGSSYRLLEPLRLAPHSKSAMLGDDCRFAVDSGADSPGTALRVEGHILQLVRPADRIDTAHTVRWKYRISRP